MRPKKSADRLLRACIPKHVTPQDKAKHRAGLFDQDRAVRHILKECIWEYDLDAEEILGMARQGTAQEMKFLYGKILQNSQHLLEAVSLFSAVDLKFLHDDFRAGPFQREYLEKRNNMIGFFYFREALRFPELQWRI